MLTCIVRGVCSIFFSVGRGGGAFEARLWRRIGGFVCAHRHTQRDFRVATGDLDVYVAPKYAGGSWRRDVEMSRWLAGD